MTLGLLADISRSANQTTSIESLFREIGRQLLSGELADAISLLIYDRDGTRITENLDFSAA